MQHVWGTEGPYTGFWWGNMKEVDHLGDRCRWEDNIKMNFSEVGCEGVNWIELAQDRERLWALVNAVMNFRVP